MINKAFYRTATIEAQKRVNEKRHNKFMDMIKYSIILQDARITITGKRV